MPMSFAKPALMAWNGNLITDHNRAALDIEVDRIEKTQRMANGMLRKYIVADKRKFSCSWENLPSKAKYAVDGYWAANEIETWWNTVPGAFTLTLQYAEDAPIQYTVVMTEFSKTLSKRGLYDLYSVNVNLEEV